MTADEQKYESCRVENFLTCDLYDDSCCGCPHELPIEVWLQVKQRREPLHRMVEIFQKLCGKNCD